MSTLIGLQEELGTWAREGDERKGEGTCGSQPLSDSLSLSLSLSLFLSVSGSVPFSLVYGCPSTLASPTFSFNIFLWNFSSPLLLRLQEAARNLFLPPPHPTSGEKHCFSLLLPSPRGPWERGCFLPTLCGVQRRCTSGRLRPFGGGSPEGHLRRSLCGGFCGSPLHSSIPPTPPHFWRKTLLSCFFSLPPGPWERGCLLPTLCGVQRRCTSGRLKPFGGGSPEGHLRRSLCEVFVVVPSTPPPLSSLSSHPPLGA